jgi:hypothetical protein
MSKVRDNPKGSNRLIEYRAIQLGYNICATFVPGDNDERARRVLYPPNTQIQAESMWNSGELVHHICGLAAEENIIHADRCQWVSLLYREDFQARG